jgi:UDP-N-acetylenolpyruvoylglucosamine reductase
VLGPLFASDPQLPILEMLREVRADRIRVGSLSLDGKFPLFIRNKGGSVRASEVRELIEQVQELINQRYGVVPQTRYQYLGVW